MTVEELIKRLSEYPSETRVLIYDADAEAMETKTGFLYDVDSNELELCSDATD